jgi:putative DNA primase/helicase
MTYDGSIDIAVGKSAKSKVWKNKRVLYSEFVRKLSQENKTNETYKEFISANKDEQGTIKDVGGYVGGYLRNGRRNPKNVVHRQILTLDIDFAHLNFWDDFTLQFGNAAVLHSTHKHCEANPRYRLLIPLSREVSPDEYVAIARKIAGVMGIDLFDNTTFETNRLMFWPSTPKDVDYYFESQDGPWVDADEVLNSYVDWKDTSLWPTAQKSLEDLVINGTKQEDPENKKGIVGAFCRTYTITLAIKEFLSDVYIATDHEDRYTYRKGSTAAGLIVYQDKFAFSHHGTDPCSGKLSNAFDLVRIHLYGHKDGDSTVTGNRQKSFKAMEDLVQMDKKVKLTIARENLSTAKYDFSEDDDDDDYDDDEVTNVEGDNENIDWMTELDVDTRGRYLSTANNINAILANDKRLKEAFKQNDFDSKRYVFKNLPWRKIDEPEPIRNVDYAGVRNYIESVYGISGTLKIDDSLALEFEKRSFHPIKDYLYGLEWDGTPRLETLLIEYFGADDNLYTREAIRKTLVGAVARVLNPGCKFDLVLTLVGDQGTNKSSFFKLLGKEWFSDTFMTVQGKEALEQIQGAWIIEIAELSGFRKAEVEAVKHFLTKQEDQFRPAYARASETFKRQCIFIGTTNKKDFLNDPTGNRRFMPIDVNPKEIKKDVWSELPDEVDQIWAEAMVMYREGEDLYLSGKAEKAAKSEQMKHSEVDDRRGLIEQYLEKGLPKDWDEREIFERRTYMEDPIAEGQIERQYVCVAEIWCECLGKDKENMNRYTTREINDIMKSLDEWEYHSSTKTFQYYGKQKYYSRKSIL